MTNHGRYTPGPAGGAQVRKDGEKWTLIRARELCHPPEKVWQALTDPAHLREWAPFDADANLGTPGAVKLTWVGTTQALETKATRADAPKVLEYNDVRWELEPLWHSIDRRFISIIGRMAGGDALKFDGWQRLNAEYGKQFGIEIPNWAANAPKR